MTVFFVYWVIGSSFLTCLFGNENTFGIHGLAACCDSSKIAAINYLRVRGEDCRAYQLLHLIDNINFFVQFYLESLAPLHCLCFGSFGDTAANLLWRIQHGEVENFTPKVIIVSIGQSDAEMDASDFLATLNTIALTLKKKQPNAELFFLVIFYCNIVM